MADVGCYSDCCRRWWLGPRARLRITQGPGEAGLLPHTPEAGVPPASHAGLPKLSSLSGTRMHAGLLFHPQASLREQLAGPTGASGGGEWDGVSRCWPACSPWAPCSCACMHARVLGFWAPFPFAKPGRLWFHRSKATGPLLDAWPCGQNSRIVSVLFMASS